MGRFWIEASGQDGLYLFDWTFVSEPIQVSQALSLVVILVLPPPCAAEPDRPFLQADLMPGDGWPRTNLHQERR